MITTEDDIRQVAINLLKVHNVDTSSAIDIRNLIELSGIPITWRVLDLKGISGFTCQNARSNSYCMFIDETLIENCPARLNFTIAHEYGHIVLDHFNDINDTLDMSYLKERAANIFVDEILMPTHEVFRHRMDAREIADVYNVSITAAYNKIKYLKHNSIYKKEKALETAQDILNRLNVPLYNWDYNSQMVDTLHEHWLDPDFSVL